MAGPDSHLAAVNPKLLELASDHGTASAFSMSSPPPGTLSANCL